MFHQPGAGRVGAALPFPDQDQLLEALLPFRPTGRRRFWGVGQYLVSHSSSWPHVSWSPATSSAWSAYLVLAPDQGERGRAHPSRTTHFPALSAQRFMSVLDGCFSSTTFFAVSMPATGRVFGSS